MPPRRKRPPTRVRDDEDDGEYEYDYVTAFAGEFANNPQVRNVIAGVNGLVDKARKMFDENLGGVPRPQVRPPQNGHARQAPPPQRPQVPREDPRQVLGFGRDVKLTSQMIKERRRQLAMIFHGDRGGNDITMARVNAAADVLLQQFGK